jgi:hypothetical protein
LFVTAGAFDLGGSMHSCIQNTVACLLIVTMVVGVSGQSAPQTSADAKEVASYRLTMDTLKKVQVATRVMMEQLKKDPKFQKDMKLQEEIKALEQKEELTEAEQARLDALREEREQLQTDADANLGNAQSLDEMEAQIKRFPPMADGLRQAGLSPREYATFMMAMVQAAMVAGFKKTGMMKELPKDVNAENVKFVEEHEAELKAMQAEFEKLGKRQ